jgi:short-subunit dehydrogenase
MQLAGKVALITGASAGIGAACVAALRKRGARLILTARDTNRLAEVCGPEDLTVPADLTLTADRLRLIQQALAAWGRVDILINNAGVGLYGRSWECDPEKIRYLYELNLFAPIELARAVMPQMGKQGNGAVVNVTSVAALAPLPWFPHYSAAKAALESLSAALRMEAPGLQVMTLCPGYVETGFQDHALAGRPPAALRRARSRTAVSAADCAEALVRGLERGFPRVYIPWWTRWVSLAYAVAPSLIESRLKRMLRDSDGSSLE